MMMMMLGTILSVGVGHYSEMAPKCWLLKGNTCVALNAGYEFVCFWAGSWVTIWISFHSEWKSNNHWPPLAGCNGVLCCRFGRWSWRWWRRRWWRRRRRCRRRPIN